MALVLKTSDCHRSVGSNPTASANFYQPLQALFNTITKFQTKTDKYLANKVYIMQENLLQEIGINAGLVVSGLFGSLLTIKKGASARVGSIAISLVTGIGSANYITPIVVDTLGIDNQNLTFGIAFILGFLGLSGIEYAIKKFMPEAIEETAPRKRRLTRKKPINRKRVRKR